MVSVIQCNPVHKAWDVGADGTCVNMRVLFLFDASFHIITNFGILVLPLRSIFILNLAQSKRVMLLCLFCILGGLYVCPRFDFRVLPLSSHLPNQISSNKVFEN